MRHETRSLAAFRVFVVRISPGIRHSCFVISPALAIDLPKVVHFLLGARAPICPNFCLCAFLSGIGALCGFTFQARVLRAFNPRHLCGKSADLSPNFPSFIELPETWQAFFHFLKIF
jgi:hypothetical protein